MTNTNVLHSCMKIDPLVDVCNNFSIAIGFRLVLFAGGVVDFGIPEMCIILVPEVISRASHAIHLRDAVVIDLLAGIILVVDLPNSIGIAVFAVVDAGIWAATMTASEPLPMKVWLYRALSFG